MVAPRALDLDVYRGVAGAIADMEQPVARSLARAIHAGIEPADRLDPAAWERQAQDRLR
jgi:hypothetical protein